MKRIVTVIVMAAAILVAVPSFPVGAARVPDLQCGVNPTTSVRLRADLTCSERFQIQAGTPPITIDLDGHTLTFTDRTCLPGPPIFRCDITDSSGGLTITHGTVAGSLSLGQNATSAHPVQVLKVHVTDPVDTWGPVAVTHSVLDGKVSSFGAISLEHNTLRGGVKISDQLAGTPIDIVDNTIVGSPAAGIEVSVVFDFDRVGGTIAGNDIRTSAGAGIDIHGMGSNGLGALDIVNNHLTSNGGDGISYAQDNRFPERFGMGPVMVTNNTARSNGGHGINIRDAASGDPATGVFDGGGNTARYNALSPRCIGVVCNTDDRRRPAISWSQPAAIVTGTPLGPDQLNATASVPGTFTYTPVAGTVLDPGGYSLTVRFVPDDLVHYQATTFGVALEVKKFPILPPP